MRTASAMIRRMNDFRVLQIDHVELFVPDQRAAADWYGRVFGLQVLEHFAHWAATGPLMVTTADGQTKLALFEGEPARASRRAAFRRVAFRVEADGFVEFLGRLDELDLLDEAGNPVTRDGYVDHGAALSIYFCDPWRHAFEITTYDPDGVRGLLG